MLKEEVVVDTRVEEEAVREGLIPVHIPILIRIHIQATVLLLTLHQAIVTTIDQVSVINLHQATVQVT